MRAHNKHMLLHHKQHLLVASLVWSQSLKLSNHSLPLEGWIPQQDLAAINRNQSKISPPLNPKISGNCDKRTKEYQKLYKTWRWPTWLWFSNNTMYKASAQGLSFSVHWTISCSWWNASGFWYHSSKSLAVRTKYLLK